MGIKKLLTVAALLAAGGLTHSAWAQTDVTSTYLTNADFSQGTIITPGVCTYAKDKASNSTSFANLVELTGWSVVNNADGSAGGLFEIGGGAWLGGNHDSRKAPATNSDGEAEGNVLGLVSCWGGAPQYTQDLKTALPAGTYTLVLAVYNSGSPAAQNAIESNLIGFVESGGTTHYATTTTYPIKEWKYEFLTFTLESESNGYVSIGCKMGGSSNNSQHLFISGLSLFSGEVDAEAYAAAKEAERNAKEVALNKEKLAGSCYWTPSADLLVNGSFDTENHGWTLTDMVYQQNSHRPTRYAEKWSGEALSGSGSAIQTIKNLPAGAYHLTAVVNAQLQSDQNLEITGVTLSVNNDTIAISGPWKDYEIIYNHENDGDVTVSFAYNGTNANWVSVDEFSLVYGGDYETYISDKEVLQYKKPWSDALATATAAIDDAKYANVTGVEKTALQAEIAKAEPTTEDGYIAATTALTDATSAFINAAASYDSWVSFKTTFAAYNPETFALPYASAEKKTAFENAFNTTPSTAAEAASIMPTLRAYIESNSMAEGVDGAVDYTSNITNASEPANTEGWTVSNVSTRNTEGWTNSEGNSTHAYFDGGNWSATGWTASMKQDVTIPAGRYLLTAIGRASTEVTFTMSVGEASVNLPNVGGAGNVFDRGWNDASLEFTTPGKAAQETVTIQVDAATAGLHQWFSVSNFRLVLLEATEILNASEAEYAALQSAIAAAEAKTLGFEAGEYAPYNNVATLKTLAAAKAIDPASDNTSEVVVAATTALNEAVWTANAAEVSAIDLTKLYDANNKDDGGRLFAPGWDKAGGTNAYNTRLVQGAAGNAGMAAVDGELALFTKFGTNYGKEYGYTMPLKANTTYKLTFKFGAWGENKEIVSRFTVTDANDNTVEITPSSFTRTNNSGLANEDVNAWFDYVGVFTTGEAGDYVLTMTKDNNGEQRQIVMGNISLVKAPEATATMSISAAKYGTFIAPFDVEIPDGVTASKITGVDVNGVTLIEEAVEGTIPANTPVLLYSETEVNEEFTAQSLATQDTYTVGLLTGNLSGETINAPMDSYILLNGANGVGFYRVVTEDVTVKNNRVYLTDPAAQAKAFFSFGGGATGINGIEGAEGATEVVRFNAAGVQVAAPVKGLNIVKMSDGTVKKVMVK